MRSQTTNKTKNGKTSCDHKFNKSELAFKWENQSVYCTFLLLFWLFKKTQQTYKFWWIRKAAASFFDGLSFHVVCNLIFNSAI